MFKKLMKCLVVAAAVAPAGITPALAGCCGAFSFSGSATNSESATSSASLVTTDTVTNTSMQMTVTENATFVPTTAAPTLGNPDTNGAGADCNGEVL